MRTFLCWISNTFKDLISIGQFPGWEKGNVDQRRSILILPYMETSTLISGETFRAAVFFRVKFLSVQGPIKQKRNEATVFEHVMLQSQDRGVKWVSVEHSSMYSDTKHIFICVYIDWTVVVTSAKMSPFRTKYHTCNNHWRLTNSSFV